MRKKRQPGEQPQTWRSARKSERPQAWPPQCVSASGQASGCALAAAEEQRISDARWAEQMPSTDYAAICEAIRKS
jgi:hypothetical protein